MVAKQLSQLHSHQTPPMVGWKKGIGDILWASFFFLPYEGEKSFPEAIQCPVDLLLYPSYQNWNTCLFLNPSGKVGDGIIISDLTRNFSIASFFYKGTGSKHFRLCVQYMSVLYILPLFLIFTTFLNVKTILSHAPVCWSMEKELSNTWAKSGFC